MQHLSGRFGSAYFTGTGGSAPYLSAMRGLCAILLLTAVFNLAAQPVDDAPVARPFMVYEAVALPMSAAQVMQAAQDAWPWTFGQQPGANLISTDPAEFRMEGVMRFNFKSSTPLARQSTLGVINYQVTITATNGACKVRATQFVHSGNKNAPGGPIDLGRIYAGPRPDERVPGLSKGSAQRLNDDMRQQLADHVHEVVRNFARRMRTHAADK